MRPEEMPNQMQPQMPQQQPGAPEQGSGEDDQGIQAALEGVHTKMLRVKEILDGVPEVNPKLKEQLSGIITGYQGFVSSLAESVRGGGSGTEPQAVGSVGSPAGAASPGSPGVSPRGPVLDRGRRPL